MKKILLSLVFCSFLLTGSLTAQYTGAKDAVAFRYLLPNHLLPATEVWDADDFGRGLEFEYGRYLNDVLNLAVPFKMYQANLPADEQGAFFEEGLISLDLLLQLKLFREPRFVYPNLFAGIGANLEGLSTVNYAVPLGVGLNFRLNSIAYLSLKGEYRFALEESLRDNLQIGAGLYFLLGEAIPEKEPEEVTAVSDFDGDGIPDEQDLCPNEAGLPELYGCPDKDGDGIPDGEDACPEIAGVATLRGCPDRDNDGLSDMDDECPDEAGPASMNGCPLKDADGDGIADADDECPNEAGTTLMRGCPDRDFDKIADKDDRCPDTFGPASNQGCPELTQEDKEVLTFAMKAVQFETGKATLRQESYTVLNQVADILQRYPDYKLRIGGHTDSVGDAAFNMRLSEDRAKACYDYILLQGIAPARVTYTGFGETRPIANNTYKAGREQNRRVEFDIYLE